VIWMFDIFYYSNDFAQVLVETEFEIPDWFNAHYLEHNLSKDKKINKTYKNFQMR